MIKAMESPPRSIADVPLDHPLISRVSIAELRKAIDEAAAQRRSKMEGFFGRVMGDNESLDLSFHPKEEELPWRPIEDLRYQRIIHATRDGTETWYLATDVDFFMMKVGRLNGSNEKIVYLESICSKEIFYLVDTGNRDQPCKLIENMQEKKSSGGIIGQGAVANLLRMPRIDPPPRVADFFRKIQLYISF